MKMQVKPLLLNKCLCVHVMFKSNATDSESCGLPPVVYFKTK